MLNASSIGYVMDYTGEQPGHEMASLKKAVSSLQRQVAELERVVRNVESGQRSSEEQMLRINEILVGKNGENGLRDNVERMVMIMDGDSTYHITGTHEEIEALKRRIGVLEDQRNMIKWGLVGVGLAGATNIGAIITVLVKSFGG